MSSVPGPADLPDINVWLALGFEEHPHRERATHYWATESRDRILFCRLTALGLLRLCMNPVVTGNKPLTARAAWDRYAAVRAVPEIELAAEPPGTDELLGSFAEPRVRAAGFWTDAYLAAFAIAGGYRLVTFDGGIERVNGLEILHLV